MRLEEANSTWGSTLREKIDLRLFLREKSELRESLRESVHFPSSGFLFYNMIGIFLRCQKTDLGENAEEEISLPVVCFLFM